MDVIKEQSINSNNYQKLKELFPHAVSVDEDGKYVIDPQKLQMSLDPSKAEIKEDGYGLNWVGKKEAYHNAFTKNYKVLKPLKDDSKNWDETENILIKGDNLDALKILRHNYFESIKMIYIDPPYNTKNDDFVYNDNFTASTEQTLQELGYDKEYIDYIENIQGAKTHSGWLNFMYPRLLLAKDLLKDDGVIFISIDDNEVAQLRLLCDEVFGEENFIGQMIRQRIEGGKQDSKTIQAIHEYILVYVKNLQFLSINKKKQTNFDHYDKKDKYFEKRGKYYLKPLFNSGLNYSESLTYPIKSPDGSMITLPSDNKTIWLWSEKTFLECKANGFIEFIKNKNNEYKVYYKTYQLVDKFDNPIERSSPYNSMFLDGFTNRQSAKDFKGLFDTNFFDYTKPLSLMKELIQMGSNQNDLILDFFAGSGTTAHAVMDLNAEDSGNRKYICVQWAEETPEKSEARKAGYETIFDITKARIDKAGEKILNQVQNDDGLLQTDKILDIGFRTFEVVEDAKQKIYQKSLDEVNQDDLLSMMEKPNIESNEEILYNLFVSEALPLCTKHQELIADKLCLASNVAFILGDITSDELVDALKDKKECEYITVYSPNISNDKFTLEIESNISKLGIKPDKLRFRG